VGGGSAPHALMIIAIAIITVRVEKCFMACKYLLMNLAIRIAAACGGNAVVCYDNFPVASGNSKAAKCFKILLAVDKCSSAVLSGRAGEATTSDHQVSALAHLRYYVYA